MHSHNIKKDGEITILCSISLTIHMIDLCVIRQVISTFRKHMIEKNSKELGKLHLVLVEGEGKKSTPGRVMLTGRSDGNTRCVFPATETIVTSCVLGNVKENEVRSEVKVSLQDVLKSHQPFQTDKSRSSPSTMPADSNTIDIESQQFSDGMVARVPQEGDYALVEITEAKGQVLYGRAVAITTLTSFHTIFS